MPKGSPPTLLLASLLLAPFTGLLVPYRYSVLLQLLSIVGVLAVATLLGWKDVRAKLVATPGPVKLGLLLYFAAALWGTAVGFGAGNPTRYVCSQAASLLLLPAGFVAFTGLRRLGPMALTRALSWSAVAALAVHLSAILIPDLGYRAAHGNLRFDFVEGATATGVAALMVVVLFGKGLVRHTLLSVVGFFAALLFLAGSMSRGAWLSTGVGIVVLILLFPPHWRGQVRGLAILGITAALMAALIVASTRSGHLVAQAEFSQAGLSPGVGKHLVVSSPLLPPTGSHGLHMELFRKVPFHGSNIELQAVCEFDRRTTGAFWVQWANEAGRRVERRHSGWVAGPGRYRLDGIVARQPGADWAQVGLWVAPMSGRVRVESARVLGYSSAVPAWIRSLLLRGRVSMRYLDERIAGPTLKYREREFAAVTEEWRSGGVLRKLAGQGLGRTFLFDNKAWGPGGKRVTLKRASYIHDFYLFLFFKLGLMGLAALVGLVVIVSWTIGMAWRVRRDRGTEWIFAATAAAWVTYLVWSVTSPEIYDFRVAPVWGVLIAVCVRQATRDGTAPAPASDEVEREQLSVPAS